MYQKVKRLSQALFVLTLITIVSSLSILFINTYSDSIIVTAQENSFDLKVTKTANVSSVASGGTVTFTILIENQGPDPALFVTFFDDYPTQMQNVQYMFSTAVISRESETPEKPYWLFTEIVSGQTVVATVTGQLVSASYTTVKNEAAVSALGELTPADNTDDASVTISNGGTAQNNIYLPLIRKDPLPEKILAYYENFSNNNAWYNIDPDDNFGGCYRTEHTSGIYRVTGKEDNSCLPFARNANKPESPYRTYGEFEVTAYADDDYQEDDHWYGIFINGQGEENYYLFRIKPNQDSCTTGGDWELIRRINGGNLTLASGACDPAINRGYEVANILTIRHQSNQISVYANSTPLETVTNNELTGQTPGVYVKAASNKKAQIKFDDFRVYKFP